MKSGLKRANINRAASLLAKLDGFAQMCEKIGVTPPEGLQKFKEAVGFWILEHDGENCETCDKEETRLAVKPGYVEVDPQG